MVVPDGVDLKLCHRVSEVELLVDLIVLSNIFRTLFFNILAHYVFICDDFISNVFAGFFPWKIVPTKFHPTIRYLLFPLEC